MLSTANKLYQILGVKEKRKAKWIFVMILFLGIFEMIGVASVVPFIYLVAEPAAVETNFVLAPIFRWTGIESRNNQLFFFGLLVLFLLVFSIGFRAWTNYVITKYAAKNSFLISSRLIAIYLQHPYDWFLGRHTADLGKTILNEVDHVIVHGLLPLAAVISGTMTIALVLLLLIFSNPMIAVCAAAILVLSYFTLFAILRRKMYEIGQARSKYNKLKYQTVLESFGGIKEIKVAGLESVFADFYKAPAKKFAQAEAAHVLAGSMPRYLFESIAFCGIMVLALYLLYTTGDLKKAAPTLALYSMAGYRLMPIAQQVYQGFTSIRYAENAVCNLHHELLSEVSLVDSLEKRQNISLTPIEFTNQIELKDVSFSYPQSQTSSLNSVSIRIPAFSTTGFVGMTGSGKSTVVDIILGLLKPDSGQMLIDGKSLDEGNVRMWQKSIGYVPQHIFLIDDTIAANIAFGVPKSSIDQNAVERAAKVANIHEHVSCNLPNGYGTVIGERGVRLSGGERQRIGIARAVYHNPSILVLDEATSALDNKTEEAVMAEIRKLSHRVTIILIAHRLDTLKKADNVFLMERGRVVANGSYDCLIASNKKFQSLALATDSE